MAGMTIPSFQNYDAKTQRKDFIRGYVMNATGGQTEFPQFAAGLPGYGYEWKKEVKSRYVAQARVWNAGGEMLARKDNFVELDPEVRTPGEFRSSRSISLTATTITSCSKTSSRTPRNCSGKPAAK